MSAPARYWHERSDGRIQCDLCPRFCALQEGQRGMCFVRLRQDNQILLDTYGRSSGFCIDPIEKKPLNHFLPGTPVLSFGTAGCNLACKFCQNHDISKAKDQDRLSAHVPPQAIANAARNAGCASVAFTYNDPVIFHEYAVDTAKACRERGIASVAVTAGYISPEPRVEFFDVMDAANIDLKAFSEAFYFKLTGAHLAPVLETIEYVAKETNCWLELTTLLIPGENDGPEEIEALSAWVFERCGPEVPLHFTAFHPDFRMQDHPATPIESLLQARKRAKDVGLKHVYIGNAHHIEAQSSCCHACGSRVIERDWYALNAWHLDGKGHCNNCKTKFAGRIQGPPGDWGRKRKPVRIIVPEGD